MKPIMVIIILLILTFCLASCYTEWMPQSGVWYSEELQMQISFDGGESFAVIDGRKIVCIFENDRSSKCFTLLSQDRNAKDIPIGQELFCGERISLTENEFVVKEEKTGQLYVFRRVVKDKTD